MSWFWIAFLSQFFWAMSDVFSRIALNVVGVHSVIYACVSLFMAASVLVIVAGPGKGGLETIRAPQTWVYGFFHILMQIFQAYCYTLVTTTEGNLLFRLTLILSIFSSWLILHRKPIFSDYLGMGAIMAGLFYIASGLPEDIRPLALFSVFCTSVCYVILTMLAETHPVYKETDDIKSQSRVVGYVLMVSSLFFLIAFMGASYVGQTLPEADKAFFTLLPHWEDFYNPKAIITSVLGGLIFVATAKYFYFYAAHKVNTENYLLIACFIPVITLFLEYLAHLISPLDISGISSGDLMAGAVITLGALFMVVMRQKKQKTCQPSVHGRIIKSRE